MATIGTFTKTESGFTGTLHTLAVNAQVSFRKNGEKQASNHPGREGNFLLNPQSTSPQGHYWPKPRTGCCLAAPHRPAKWSQRYDTKRAAVSRHPFLFLTQENATQVLTTSASRRWQWPGLACYR